MRDFAGTSREYAVLDVGGGSVQVLIGNAKNLRKVHTMQTGAQFLHDNFTKDSGNPKSFTTLGDIERMKKHIVKELFPLKRQKNMPIIYGSSNIIDLMKAIGIPLKTNKDCKDHPYKTYAKYLNEFIARMLPFCYEKRETLFDFQRGYMWGIDKAFLNVTLIANRLGSSLIIPSNENIARGIMCSFVKR
jgi:exopolyphosphatase/pppGpp-phosphohydrolase